MGLFPDLAIRADYVADHLAIQYLQAAYMRCIGSGDFEAIVDLFDLDDPKVSLAYAGRPALEGREALLEEWQSLKAMFEANGGTLGAHMLTTPMISVTDDGKCGRGAWQTFGFTFVGAAFGVEPRRAMPTFAAYDNQFRKTASGWRIVHVKWEIVATFADTGLSDQWGWVRAPRASPFPFAN